MGQREQGGRGDRRGWGEALPRARREGVLATDVGDEVVVYDSKDHRAHCLNAPVAAVWRNLDGQTTMNELVTRLGKELHGPADEEAVWLALQELDKASLLEGQLHDRPSSSDVSRRHALRRLGIAAGGGAVLLPAISSILAPPVHAQVSAIACPTPDTCSTFTCLGGGCACAPTTEGTRVCIVPRCVAACTTTADCPAGTVCFTLGCCGPATFCVPIGTAGTCAPTRSGPAWTEVLASAAPLIR